MSKEIIKKLKKLSSLIQKDLSPRAEIILFGSYAKGKATKWSDIDVAVILPKVDDRLRVEVNLRLKSLKIDERINPFVFSSEEVNQNSPLIWEIKKYGKSIL